MTSFVVYTIVPRVIALFLLAINTWFVRDLWRGMGRRLHKWLRLTVMVIAVALVVPVMAVAAFGFAGFTPFRNLPGPWVAFFQLWHFSMIGYGLVHLLAWPVNRACQYRRRRPAADLPANPGRRALLAGPLLVLPPVLTGYFLAHVAASRHDCQINTLRFPLFGEERGGEIARLVQISDLHLCQYFGPERLEFYFDQIARLSPQLLLVTGDLINTENRSLAETIPLWKALTRQFPTIGCLGNHDYIDNLNELRRLAERAGIDLLVNDYREVNVAGVPLRISGTDFSFTRTGYSQRFAKMYAGSTPPAVCVLLAHNPVAFKDTDGWPMDLMLSGHTHGGQIVFNRDRNSGTIIDPFVAYSRGLYTRGSQSLYVNSGLGSWFVLRLNCPPEITVIEISGSCWKTSKSL